MLSYREQTRKLFRNFGRVSIVSKIRMNRFLLSALLLGSVTATSVYMTQRSSEQTEARQLSQSLRRHQYYYQQAIEHEDQLVRATLRTLDSGKSDDSLGHEALDLKAQFEDLHRRLNSLPVDGRVRMQMLDPLLRQLSEQASELQRFSDRFSTDPEGLREHLRAYRQPENLLTPALQEIAERYGLPRPKLWRGRPLVS